jgi:hypothetical protein
MAEVYRNGGTVCKSSGNDIICTSSIPGAVDGCTESGSTKTCCTSGSCVSTTTTAPVTAPVTPPVTPPTTPPTDTVCDCEDRYKVEINALIARRNKGEDVRDELGKYVALRAECVKRCTPVAPVVAKKSKTVPAVVPSKPTVRDKRRVVYSSGMM